MPASVSITARAMRLCAAISVVAACVGLAFDVAMIQMFETLREEGRTLDETLATVQALQWLGLACHLAGYVAVLVLGWSWARRADRRAALARVGWFLLLGSFALWAVGYAARGTADSEAAFETLEWLQLGQLLLSVSGMTLLLAGTPGPAWRALVFAVLATTRVVLVVSLQFSAERPELPWWWVAGVGLLADVVWGLGLWLGAAHCTDDEPSRATSLCDDRSSGALGLRIVRGAFIVRIAIAVLGVAVMVASRESGPGGLWIMTFASICAAIAVGVGLTRYSCLPNQALSRGAVSVVLAALALGAALDVYATDATATLLQWSAKVQNSSSMWEMPSISEAEAIQAKARWSSGAASFLGLVGALGLTMSLRATARWLGDEPSVRKADALGVLTLLGGTLGVGGVTALQSGAVRSAAVLGVLGIVALVFGVWVVVAWLGLFRRLVSALETPPVTEP